jgi:O-antigen ligase
MGEIMERARLSEPSRSNVYLLFWLLCAFTLGMGIAQTHDWFDNALIVMDCEILFILCSILLLKRIVPFNLRAMANPVLAILLILWACSVSVSFFFSPYALSQSTFAGFRYVETLIHVLFAVYVWHLLAQLRGRAGWLLAMLPLASAVVLVSYFVVWYGGERELGDWFHQPVLNSHIRHTGYQLTAALAVFLVVLLDGGRFRRPLLIVAGLALLWGFLFWTGGRAAALSVTAIAVLLLALCQTRDGDTRYVGNMILVSLLLGLLLSELFAVFPWNGVLQGALRTVGAENFNQLSSNRLAIWQATWESIKENPFFGLGPQGYLYMPNRVYGVQPHSVLLQFLAEWGLIGSLLFVTVLLRIFFQGLGINVLAAPAPSPVRLAAGAVIVALTIHGLVDGTYFHPQPSYYLALAYAIWALPGETSTAASD